MTIRKKKKKKKKQYKKKTKKIIKESCFNVAKTSLDSEATRSDVKIFFKL